MRIPRKSAVYGVVILLGLLALQNVLHSSLHNDLVSQQIHAAYDARSLYSANPLAIVAGELPGYTGWARPQQTLAGHFGLFQISTPEIHVNKDWFFTVSCQHDACQQGGAHFYVRAYGPSVISGQVRDNHDGKYDIRLAFLNPGRYTLEVVLVASHAPELSDFPVVREPAYEGYMLPDFPMQLLVAAADDDNEKRQNTSPPLCSFNQLVEENGGSAYGKRRWVVVNKNTLPTNTTYWVKKKKSPPSNASLPILSVEGYRSGHNSLGIQMDYIPKDCSLLPQNSVSNSDFGLMLNLCLKKRKNNTTPVRIIFVGDSVSLLQEMKMNATLSGIQQDMIRTSRISTSGGIRDTLENAIKELDQLKKEYPEERRFVLFNTGLHDIAQLCSEKYRAGRIRFYVQGDVKFSCSDEYRIQLRKLVRYIQSYPAELKVFQSTSAGWLRYGNYGFGWSPSEKQLFSMSSNYVAHFNEIANDVVTDESVQKRIQVMDAYWISLARPDNRQVGANNEIGKHLVHPGTEVLDALERIWWMLIFRTLCGNALDNIFQVIYGHHKT